MTVSELAQSRKHASGFLGAVLAFAAGEWIGGGDFTYRHVLLLGAIVFAFTWMGYAYIYVEWKRRDREEGRDDPEQAWETTRPFAQPVPDLLSISRIPIGILTAAYIVQGNPEAATTAFLVGIGTDILDGMIARGVLQPTPFGKSLDGFTDAFLHAATALGIVIATARGTWEASHAWVLFGLVAVFAVSKFLVGQHSVLAKYRSGLTRSVLFVLLWLQVADPDYRFWTMAAALFMALIGGYYEWHVAKLDVAEGRRDWVDFEGRVKPQKLGASLVTQLRRFVGRNRKTESASSPDGATRDGGK